MDQEQHIVASRFAEALHQAYNVLGEEIFWEMVGGYGAVEGDNQGQMLIYTGFFPYGETCEDA